MAPARAIGKYSPHLHTHYTLPATDTYNRGVNGEEVQDEGFNMSNARRRSNSSSYAAGLKDFKTKFEQIETEPVFEESVHGPGSEDEFEKLRTVYSSESGTSMDEEDVKKV